MSRRGLILVHDGRVAVEVRHGESAGDGGDVLDGHVSLDLRCLDRIYLNGYLPTVQVGGQVVQFLARPGCEDRARVPAVGGPVRGGQQGVGGPLREG